MRWIPAIALLALLIAAPGPLAGDRPTPAGYRSEVLANGLRDDLGGRLLALDTPFHVLYRQHKNPLFETVMRRARQRRFEKAIWEVNEDLKVELVQEDDIIERVQSSVGSAFSRQESGSHAGNIRVYPSDLEGLPIAGFDIANKVRAKIGPVPEARCSAR